MSDNKINVLVGANIGGLTTGLKEAASAIQKGGEQIQASSEKAAKSSATAFKTLQQEYRQTYKDSQILAQQQGINSAAFLEAATKAGEYKNQLDDVAEVTKAMSSDTPVLSAALGVGQGLAGAFAAAQGAMALFGSDSKVLQETMLKVQASMALLQGLQALGGLGNAFVALKTTIVTTLIPALLSLQTVIMANPYIAIAAAIIAIGTAVYIWTTRTKDNTEALDANIKKNQEARTALQKIIDFRLASIANVDEREKAQLVEKQRRERADLDKEFHDKAQYNELKISQEKMFQQQLNDLAEKQSKKKETKKKTTTDDSLPSWYKGGLAPIEGIASRSGIAIKGLTDSMLNLKQIGSESFLTLTTHASRFQQEMWRISDQVGKALISLGEQGFGQFAQMAGAAMMGETVDWGQAAAQMISQIASTLGAGLIEIGAGLLIVNPALAAAYLLGGAAIMAVAGAFGTNKGSSKSAGGGGGSSPAPDANYSSNTGSALSFKPMSTFIEVGGQVRGNNLKISLINTDISNRRVK
jgi:hypothetical protein